jgi:hypothetical protein
VAEIHAEYRRVFQVKPYETETITLSITDEVRLESKDSGERSKAFSAATAVYYKQLAEIGDKLMEERLEARKVPF